MEKAKLDVNSFARRAGQAEDLCCVNYYIGTLSFCLTAPMGKDLISPERTDKTSRVIIIDGKPNLRGDLDCFGQGVAMKQGVLIGFSHKDLKR